MKISSPVGEFPFTISGIHLHRGRLIVEGQMGRWPANAEIDLFDPEMMRRCAPAALALAALAGGLTARQIRRSARR